MGMKDIYIDGELKQFRNYLGVYTRKPSRRLGLQLEQGNSREQIEVRSLDRFWELVVGAHVLKKRVLASRPCNPDLIDHLR